MFTKKNRTLIAVTNMNDSGRGRRLKQF